MKKKAHQNKSGALLKNDPPFAYEAKAAGAEAIRLYPGSKPAAKLRRAASSFKWFAPMARWCGDKKAREDYLAVWFDAEERSIRRVVNIHDANKWDIAEPYLLAGDISLEMAEYAIIHPSPKLVEAVKALVTP